MKLKIRKKPRKFEVGLHKKITLKDMGYINLSNDEQVTFITKDKKKYDVAKKNWGFYATPSINHRLKKEGFKTALVKNKFNRYFIMLVDFKKLSEFKNYCKKEKRVVIKWLTNGFKKS